MILIVRITQRDDKDASQSIDVMPCASIMTAEEIILGDVNNGFGCIWNNLKEAANELNNDLSYASWDEETKTFTWQDNGKGETFIIVDINVRKLNDGFQRIC